MLAGGWAIALVSASRASVLAPHGLGHFPDWMAGPLHGVLHLDHVTPAQLRIDFSVAVVAMYACFLIALACARALRPGWIVAAIVVAHAAAFVTPPLMLTDVFNYLNYGRMDVVHHLNPYVHVPAVEPVGDPTFNLSNWHHLRSPYGPLFTLITMAIAPLGVAASFWTLKALVFAASLGTVALVARAARRLGRSPGAAAAFVGLNPLLLVWGLGGDHNDALMMVLVLAAGTALLAGRDARAGAALAAALGFKAAVAPLVPVMLLAARRSRRALAGIAAAGAAVVAASLAAFGPHLPDLSQQASLIGTLSFPNVLGFTVGLGGETSALRVAMTLALVAVVVWACIAARRGAPWPQVAGAAICATLVTSSWAFPWYVLWLAPLAALAPARHLRAATLVVGAYLMLAWVPALPQLAHALHWNPWGTPLARLHTLEVKRLLH